MRAQIRVGAVLSLSGRFALQGVQAQRGLALWAEDVNLGGGLRLAEEDASRPVELVMVDDESRVGSAAALTERLVGLEQVDLLFGPYGSVLTLAAADVAERDGRLLWNHGGSTDAVVERGFRRVVNLSSPASQYFVGLLELARTAWPSSRRVALIFGPRGTFAPAVIAGAEAAVERLGFSVVCKRTYPETGRALSPLLIALRASQPEIILGVGPTEADLALAELLAEGPARAALVGLVAAPMQRFGQALGARAEGFVGPSQWEPSGRLQPDIGPGSDEFVARYRERFGETPDYPAAQVYAAGLIAQRCAALAGRLEDDALLEAARSLDLTTFFGGFKLDRASGAQVGHQMVGVQWQDGRKRVVWPAAAAEAPLRLPG